MALGIICVVVGFYGSPFVWIKFGLNIGAKRVLECITIDNMLTTREISFQLNKNEMQVKNDIFLLIRKRYLEGYIFDGEKLTLNENEKPQKKLKVGACERCGANLDVVDNKVHCPYCGNIREMEKK